MTRNTAAFLLFFCLSVVATNARAQWGFTWADQRDWTVSLISAHLDHGIDGDLRWGGALGNSTLDVESVLDLDNAEEFAGWLDLQPGNALFRLGYIPLVFSGESVLTANAVVNGITYVAGDRVKTDLELNNYQVTFGYKIRLGNRLMIAPVFQLNVLDGLMDTVDLDLAGSAAKEEFLAPLPLVGLRVEFYPIPRLAFFAEAKGFKASNWGELEDATVTDGEVGASFSLTRNLVLTAAYRLTNFKFDVSDTATDLDLSGLTFSAAFRF